MADDPGSIPEQQAVGPRKRNRGGQPSASPEQMRRCVKHARSLMEQGHSLRSACTEGAKLAGVSYRSVERWGAAELSQFVSQDNRQRLLAAHRIVPEYTAERRRGAIDKLLAAAERKIEQADDLSPRDLASLATALAIGIDKRRLEEGEATGRYDWRDTKQALEAGRARLTMLRTG